MKMSKENMRTPDNDLLSVSYKLMMNGKYEEAFPLLTSLAEEGSEYACLYLAWLYQKGLGVAQDHQKAQTWYRAVADTGSPIGQHYLGNLLRKLSQFEEAFEWHKRSADAGYLPAIYRVSKMYIRGQGIAKQNDMAQMYLSEAAVLGHLFAKRDVAIQMFKGYFGYGKIPIGFCKWIAAITEGFFLAIKNPDSEKLS